MRQLFQNPARQKREKNCKPAQGNLNHLSSMHWELRHYDLEEQKKSTQKLGVVKDATAATRARVTSQNVVPAET